MPRPRQSPPEAPELTRVYGCISLLSNTNQRTVKAVYPLGRPLLRIGRNPSTCDIVLKSNTCSKEHATIDVSVMGTRKAQLLVQGLNGVKSNARLLRKGEHVMLADGDIFELCGRFFRWEDAKPYSNRGLTLKPCIVPNILVNDRIMINKRPSTDRLECVIPKGSHAKLYIHEEPWVERKNLKRSKSAPAISLAVSSSADALVSTSTVALSAVAGQFTLSPPQEAIALAPPTKHNTQGKMSNPSTALSDGTNTSAAVTQPGLPLASPRHGIHNALGISVGSTSDSSLISPACIDVSQFSRVSEEQALVVHDEPPAESSPLLSKPPIPRYKTYGDLRQKPGTPLRRAPRLPSVEDPTYSSMQDMLELCGYQHTRVITPMSQKTPTPPSRAGASLRAALAADDERKSAAGSSLVASALNSLFPPNPSTKPEKTLTRIKSVFNLGAWKKQASSPDSDASAEFAQVKATLTRFRRPATEEQPEFVAVDDHDVPTLASIRAYPLHFLNESPVLKTRKRTNTKSAQTLTGAGGEGKKREEAEYSESIASGWAGTFQDASAHIASISSAVHAPAVIAVPAAPTALKAPTSPDVFDAPRSVKIANHADAAFVLNEAQLSEGVEEMAHNTMASQEEAARTQRMSAMGPPGLSQPTPLLSEEDKDPATQLASELPPKLAASSITGTHTHGGARSSTTHKPIAHKHHAHMHRKPSIPSIPNIPRFRGTSSLVKDEYSAILPPPPRLTHRTLQKKKSSLKNTSTPSSPKKVQFNLSKNETATFHKSASSASIRAAALASSPPSPTSPRLKDIASSIMVSLSSTAAALALAPRYSIAGARSDQMMTSLYLRHKTSATGVGLPAGSEQSKSPLPLPWLMQRGKMSAALSKCLSVPELKAESLKVRVAAPIGSPQLLKRATSCVALRPVLTAPTERPTAHA